jgi:hypothetical protein
VHSTKTGQSGDPFCTSVLSRRGQVFFAGAASTKQSERRRCGRRTGSYRGARGEAVETYLDDESSRWTLSFETN